MSNYDEILAAAHALPPADRAALIASLWAESSPEEWLPPSNTWIREVQRRSEAYDAGKMEGTSWEEVRQRARRKAGLDG